MGKMGLGEIVLFDIIWYGVIGREETIFWEFTRHIISHFAIERAI